MGAALAPVVNHAHLPIVEILNSSTDFNCSFNKEILTESEINHSSTESGMGETSIPSQEMGEPDVTSNPIDPAVEEESCGEEGCDNQDVHVRLTCLGEIVDTLMKVQLDVNGTQMLALVDTGATRSMIDQSLLNRAGMLCDRAVGLRIFGIAEPEGITAAGQVFLTTKIDGIEMKPLHFTVLPESVLPVPIVLGTDYLQLQAMKIDTGKRVLSWSSNGCDIDLHIQKDGRIDDRVVRRLQFFAAEKVIVEKGETVEVPVYWKDNVCDDSYSETLFYDGAVVKKLEGRVKGLPGVLDTCKESPIILFANSCHQRVTIQRDRPLGIFSSLMQLEEEQEGRGSWTIGELREAVDLRHLSDTQKEEFLAMLWRNVEVLSASVDDIGRLSSTPHHIELHDNTPIYQRPRRFAAPIAEEIEHQCRGLQNLGIIEESASPWSSPVVPIRKKDGSLRLCVDYRALNRVTKADKFPIPNISDSVFGLHGVQFFTKLDITKGFYQVPLDDKSKEYTAFTTPHGHWQFNVLSFGLKNAPAAFQRGMRDLLVEFPWKKVIVYVDDILIMGNTFEEHMDLVSQVLSTLLRHGVKIKLEKCEWAASSVEFLGHVVSSSGISKTKQFVDRVTDFPMPETVQQLREFLGLVNFQRKFLQNCSEVQQPLSALTGGSKNKKLEWTSEMRKAFEELKRLMREEIQLAFPDYSDDAEKLELWVDASQIGGGACLTQVQEGEIRIIAFASMTFDDAQRNYSILEKELTAMRWGVKTFRAFLYGIEFVLRTDHQPLVYLHNMRLVDSRLARTLEDLADFNFIIRYTPGRLNVAADTLSRLKPILDAGDQAQESSSRLLPAGLMYDGGPVPGGGNSLFESLLRALERVVLTDLPENHAELRKVLIDELLQHSERYYLEMNREIRKQLRSMKIVNQLPCMEVLLAASYLYHVRILVYFWGNEPVVFTALSKKISANSVPAIHLQCQAGIHFNPLVEMSAYKDRAVSPCCIVHSVMEEDLPVACGEVYEEDCIEDVPQLYSCVTVEPECSHTTSRQPMISLRIGKVECCAILDTGAEASLVCTDVLARNGWVPEAESQERLELVGITGKKNVIKGFAMLQFQFSEDTRSKPHKFAVVEPSFIPCCVLLGLDFLASNGIVLDLLHGRCTVSGDGEASVNFLDPADDGVDFAGYIAAINMSVEELVVGSPSSNLRFKLEWKNDELHSVGSVIQQDVLWRVQRNVTQLRTLKRMLNRNVVVGKWPRTVQDFKRVSAYLSIDRDVIVYQREGLRVPVISFALMVELVLVLHHNVAHIGRDKIIALLAKQVWHPNLHKITSDVCRTCPDCQMKKVTPLRVIPPTQKIVTQRPYELMAADLVELGKTAAGYICCLVVVDHNSKWLCAVPMRDKKAATVGRALESQVLPSLLQIPEKLLTDNGPEFASALFNDVLDKYGIHHIYSTPYHPSSNGAVERVNRTIISFIAGLSARSSTWDQVLPQAVNAYNSTPHSELGVSPAHYLLKQPHDFDALPALSSDVRRVWKEGNDRFSPFAPGDRVIRRIPSSGRLTAAKFEDKYDGPFTITKVHANEVAYELREDGGDRLFIRAHYTQLRPWHDPPAYIRDHEYFQRVATARSQPVTPLPSTNRAPVRGVRRLAAPIGFRSSSSVDSSDSSTGEESGKRSLPSSPAVKTTSHFLPWPRYDVPDSQLESVHQQSASENSHQAATLEEKSPFSSEQLLSPPAVQALRRPLPWQTYEVSDSEPEASHRQSTSTKSAHQTAAEENVPATHSFNAVDDWDMSFGSHEGPVHVDDVEDDLPTLNQLIVSNVAETVFEAAEHTITQMSTFVSECCSVVSGSFSGFDVELQHQVATFTAPLLAKLEALRNVLRVETNTVNKGEISKYTNTQTRAESLPDLSIPNKTTRTYHTRSRGPVKDLPNVQQTILERKKKRD